MNSEDKVSNEFVIQILMDIQNKVGSIDSGLHAEINARNATDAIMNERLDKLEAQVADNTEKIEAVTNQVNHSKDREQAKRYRLILSFIVTGLSGMFIAKLPDIFRSLLIVLSK